VTKPHKATSEAAFELRNALLVEAVETTFAEAWLWEVDRWKELVFALLSRIVSIPEDDVRELTERLLDLELLDVGELAKLSKEVDEPIGHRLTNVMAEWGVAGEEARIAVTTIAEAARGLSDHYGGKIQRYLRHYGELMLDELGGTFTFTAIKSDAVGEAFTYWLQNVLDMPVSLVDESVRGFCDGKGFSPVDLIEAADEIDMNLALVDDVTQLAMLRRAEVAVDASVTSEG